MAQFDELDSLLRDERLTDSDWESLGEILEITDILKITRENRIKSVNEELRHSYGHTIANRFRNEYEPNYVDPILVEVAKKIKVKVNNHRVEDIEDQIIIQVIQSAKEEIIKKEGEAVWRDIEAKAEMEINELIKAGKINKDVVEELKRLRGGVIGGMILGGRVAGFALYIYASKIFFAIARFLGIRVGVAVAGPVIGGVIATLLGPIGFVVAGVTVVYDLGDTNWKKVIPAVINVACIRKRLEFEKMYESTF